MDAAPALALYEDALRPPHPLWRRALAAAWTLGGLGALMALAWAGPGRHPLIMALRAVLMVEAFGYAYHRFFQHVGWLTRRSGLIRRNQMYHWIHHMVIYPIGRWYRRELPYVAAEEGIAWSWVVPGLLAACAFVAKNGAGLGSAAFIAALVLYAKFVVDVTHSRFHETVHPWLRSRYFRRLERIHLLHHWDQRYNFTIVHPLMDALFGTYLSPARHVREIRLALEDRELTASDLINWRYLLLEATPAEYAAFICSARRHPPSVRKLDRLIAVVQERVRAEPGDASARLLLGRALELEPLVKPVGVSHSSLHH